MTSEQNYIYLGSKITQEGKSSDGGKVRSEIKLNINENRQKKKADKNLRSERCINSTYGYETRVTQIKVQEKVLEATWKCDFEDGRKG